MRLATFHSGLSRKGPGTLVRDLASGKDEQVEAVLAVIAHARPDVLLLLDMDWDHEGLALAMLAAQLGAAGLDYPYLWAPRPNAGRPSGFDLDGNGRSDEARDALGYGRFTGDGGLAILSTAPLGEVVDHGPLWVEASDVAEALLPEGAGAVMPLATVGQWTVPVAGLTLIPMAAGTPVFDGPEDRNGLRNRDELALVSRLAASADRPVVLGRANLDPADGEGRREALLDLLAHPALQDPAPRGDGGGGEGHLGDPGLDTVSWEGPGPLRVDYVLPPAELEVVGSGVVWPGAEDPFREVVEAAGTGRLVWMDVVVP
ncbi:MAG: endonuclease/exonuclease/phosphatase family protein [Pseudomonadota bacterium]